MAVATGQQAEELLTRAPLDYEKGQAAQLKALILLTVDPSFRQEIFSMTALDAFKHIISLAPQ